MRLTEEKINQIIELKKQGKTYKELQEITSCAEKTCRKYVVQAGLKSSNVVEITPELLQETYFQRSIKTIWIVEKMQNSL